MGGDIGGELLGRNLVDSKHLSLAQHPKPAEEVIGNRGDGRLAGGAEALVVVDAVPEVEAEKLLLDVVLGNNAITQFPDCTCLIETAAGIDTADAKQQNKR